MRFFKLIIFLFFLCHICVYSQEVNIPTTSEKHPLTTILEEFKNQHELSFSYDVNAIKDISLTIKKEVISIVTLQEIIEGQTSFLLQQVNPSDYILVTNTKVIDICGVVIDATSTYELGKATITSANKTIELTDNQGVFKLQMHPYDSISITYLGYRDLTIKISEFSATSCDTIRLQPEIQNLSEVLVKEYLTGGIQKNQDAAISVSSKKLRILPGLVEPDVLQSLQLLPGINSPTEDPAGLYIRGGTPGQNLVLWDGIKMYQNGHFFNQISSFNPFITNKVTVYRGGTSVRYGDRISGVIVIESDDDLTEKLQVGSGLNFTHADAYIKLPLSKKLGIMVAGRRSTTDAYQNIAYNNLVRKVFQNTRANIPDANEEQTAEERSREDDFSFSDSNFKILWKPNDNNILKFSSIFAENRLDNNKTIAIRNSGNTSSVKDVLKIRNLGLSLNWDKKYNNNIHQNINFYFSSYDQRYNLIDEREIMDNTTLDSEIITNTVKDIGGEYALHLPITKKHSIDIGYQFTYNQTGFESKNFFSDGFSSFEDEFSINGNGTNHTLYSEYKYKTSKTYINIGLRGSQLSNVNSFFIEPRVFSSYELWDNFTLNTSAELKNQQLNNYLTNNSPFGEVQALPVSDNIWILSNNSFEGEGIEGTPIRVLKSMQFTLGALYTYNGWNFDMEGYYKKITDISSLSDFILDLALPDEDDTVIFYGEEERIGIDFLVKKRINNYRFWASYSLSKTISSFPLIQDSYYRGNFDQRHVFNLSQTLKVNHFEFALGWNYATGRPFTRLFRDDDDLDGTITDPRGINSSRFKDYHRLDTSVVYRFKLDKEKDWNAMIGISIRNLYNRKNVIGQNYQENVDGDFNFFVESLDNQSLRFTPDLVLRFNF
ncbi:TonB-dependent receptor plug domain-containing protein [Aquimarina sp. 2201CG14-23]|uniref:TonB-dependent receptor plug domain-containing protein n=1 Tax=Aquimarina mycalae TaxID=3040073 RepID=UPI002477D745|nr:TonB-dependent receptor plug domain-containing protein [Aquimarina sp. 2201CG14-23]MDH7447717.1 TonB-dependent receptor plug domain-containing protein [Aquimarina sp. 2201CG14-23]